MSLRTDIYGNSTDVLSLPSPVKMETRGGRGFKHNGNKIQARQWSDGKKTSGREKNCIGSQGPQWTDCSA